MPILMCSVHMWIRRCFSERNYIQTEKREISEIFLTFARVLHFVWLYQLFLIRNEEEHRKSGKVKIPTKVNQTQFFAFKNINSSATAIYFVFVFDDLVVFFMKSICSFSKRSFDYVFCFRVGISWKLISFAQKANTQRVFFSHISRWEKIM